MNESVVRRTFVDAAYGQMHLCIAEPKGGSNSLGALPLVCLHQSPKSGREFAEFMQFAVADRVVIAPDYPGYGESDRPPAEPAVSIEDYATSIWQALDALGLAQVDLFGNHTVGSVAVEMAHQQGARVDSIGMISAAVLSAEEQVEFDQYFQPIPLDEAGTRFTTMWQRINEHNGADMSYESKGISFAEGLRGGEAYEWGHQAAFAYNQKFIERIAQLEHSIVVLNPKDLLCEITKRVEPLLKNGCVIDLPNWDASMLYTNPEEVYAVLKQSTEK